LVHGSVPGNWEEGRQLLARETIAGFLRPAFERLHQDTHLPLKIMWGSVGPFLAGMIDQLPDLDRRQAERAWWLEQPTLPGLGANPLLGTVHPGPRPYPEGWVRTTCCLVYRLPEGHDCRICPLPGHGMHPPLS
jgi:ferric iron reductase protein FhuF